jgi:lysophospholipase L1-like esterase
MINLKLRLLIIGLLVFAGSLSLSAQKRNLNIVFIGNSITYGAQLDSPQVQAPPAVASAWLRNQPGIGKVEFSNRGVSGFTTVDFLPSTNTVFNKVEQAGKAFADKSALLIFSIKLGTNDSATEGPNGSPVSAETYHDNLKAITERLLKDFPGCKIIIQRPIWYSPTTYNGAKYLQEGLTRLQTYFPQIDKLVKEDAATHPNRVFAADNKAFEHFKIYYLNDLIPEQGRMGTFYLHPNKRGAKALGLIWANEIYKVAKK